MGAGSASSISSMTQPIRSPWDTMGAAAPRKYFWEPSTAGSFTFPSL